MAAATGNSTAQGRAQMVNAMANAVVQQDPVLRHRLKSIVNGALNHMAYTMEHGTADSKMALTKSLMPHLLAGLQASEQTDAAREEAATYDRMLKFMRGEITMADFGLETVAQEQTPRKSA